MARWTIQKHQNGSKNGRYYIAEDVHDESLTHYGVKGMKWGVRKDSIKSGVKKAATKTRDFVYKQAGVKDFDELVAKVKKMTKDPKGIAMLAAIVVLPDPLVIAGIAAYKGLQSSGKLNKKLKGGD